MHWFVAAAVVLLAWRSAIKRARMPHRGGREFESPPLHQVVRAKRSDVSGSEDALQMSKEHLGFFATATGLRVFWSCSDRTGHITDVSEQILDGSVV